MPGPIGDPGHVLRCAAISYAEALIETQGRRAAPAAARAWGRLSKAALRYRADERQRGRPRAETGAPERARLARYSRLSEADEAGALDHRGRP